MTMLGAILLTIGILVFGLVRPRVKDDDIKKAITFGAGAAVAIGGILAFLTK